MSRKNLFWTIILVVSCAKCLLIPTYRSTDFEVHRNWLAITHSLPISNWYYEDTSEWTLDYPPLFAWFECGLSQIAQFFDKAMLQVSNLNYASEQTILFQRLSVIITDFVLVFAVYEYGNYLLGNKKNKEPHDPWNDPCIILSMLTLWNPGLLMVDHIHFQYNGFLSGILLLSIVRMLQNRCLESAFWFAILLNLKHIYLYIAPAYFVYLLGSYCFKKDSKLEPNKFIFANFAKLSGIVLGIFALSFGPFIFMNQTKQVLSRLFPFKRGLTHAYWAPNFWALYNTLDKGLSILGNYFGYETQTKSAMTRGLVEEYSHAVLPKVTPIVTLIISALALIPAIWVVWKGRNNATNFVRGIILCAFASFLFGWHVHEKAILLVILPLTPLVIKSSKDAEIFAFLAPIAHFSLLPLLFRPAETPIKLSLVLMHTVYIFTTMKNLHKIRGFVKSDLLPFLNTQESFYILGLIPIQIFYSFGAKLMGLEEKFPFLPLMLISAYCALGIIYSWVKMVTHSLTAIEDIYQMFASGQKENSTEFTKLKSRNKLHSN